MRQQNETFITVLREKMPKIWGNGTVKTFVTISHHFKSELVWNLSASRRIFRCFFFPHILFSFPILSAKATKSLDKRSSPYECVSATTLIPALVPRVFKSTRQRRLFRLFVFTTFDPVSTNILISYLISALRFRALTKEKYTSRGDVQKSMYVYVSVETTSGIWY